MFVYGGLALGGEGCDAGFEDGLSHWFDLYLGSEVNDVDVVEFVLIGLCLVCLEEAFELLG